MDTADVVPNGGSALHAVAPDGLVSWSSSAGGVANRKTGVDGASSKEVSCRSNIGDPSVKTRHDSYSDSSASSPGGDASGSNKDAETFSVRSVDAALVAPGANMNIWDWSVYNDSPPSPEDGAAFNLFNNLYTTNYILYYPWNTSDTHSRFRFHLGGALGRA